MQYTLTIVYTTYNAGSVTDELTFDNFYDMQEFVLENSDDWEYYSIAVC